jgi:PIN domain nuclease of toxin-antitoxin system
LADHLLLDTHVFIWWRENSPRLGADARHRIASASLVFVSVASAWEAAIKVALGKLKLPESFEAGVVAAASTSCRSRSGTRRSWPRCHTITATRSIAC